MVDVDPGVGPEGLGLAGLVAGGEAGALVIPVKWSHEDPLVTPAVSRVGYEGPGGDLATQAVCDHAALVTRGEADGQDEDGGEQQDEEEHDHHGQDGDCNKTK